MNELEKLQQTIAALEAQRAILGEVVIETALAPLRKQLAELQAQAVRAEQQRKQVTVLFADVSGFTALSETLDAEEVTEIMNALWMRLDEAITARGGMIDKHIGDAVMALWGTESAREDDPERAVKAALAMQAELRAFAETQGHPLQMRIGLNTGPVLLGGVGSTHEFTAMGDTVNVASRLEHAAPIGGILVAHDTYRQVRGVFDVVAQPPLTVKGKAEPLETYLVQRAKPRAFRMLVRGVEGVETKMVGRAAEMAQLQTAFQESLEDHALRALTVVADAGLGKTRLMQEFLHWAEVSGVDFYIFRGRTTPSTSDAPYALLRDLLAFRFEILESDSLETARAKLESGMAALCPQDEKIQEKAHFIGHLAGWDFSASPYLRGILGDAAQIRSIALHFLTLFFQNVAHESVLIFLEDLHWADLGSLEALRQVLDNLPANTPLLLMANTRPTLFERDSNWKTDRLDLRPLSATDSAALVTDILRNLRELPGSLRDLIVRQSDGNPYYAEELIKMLIDEKVILTDESEWRVQAERLATLRVPPTLTGVLQARLDSLPPAERLTIQRAAVIGRTFWDTALHFISGETLSLTELHALLDETEHRELLFRHLEAAFAETREYLFKHALLRDVAYDTVLKRERAHYHARVAEWLEKVSGARRSEYLPQLAEHYEKASKAAQAAICFEQAGDQALRVSAFADAVRFYSHVQSQNTSFFLKLAEAHFRQGDYPAARAAIEQAQATAQTDAERASALALSGEITSELGDYVEAQKILAEAILLTRAGGNQLTLCRALYALGDVNWRSGKLDDARAALDESLALARLLGDVTLELFVLNRLGTVFNAQGNWDESERFFAEVHARAVAVGNRERAMTALNNLGAAAHKRKDYSYIQQALMLAREIGVQHAIALFLGNLADMDIKLGDLPAARAKMSEGLALALRIGSLPRGVGAVANFANLAYAEGQTERALALWGLARRHPAWSSEDQHELDDALADWALAPSVVEAGLKKGEELDWDETIKELLKE